MGLHLLSITVGLLSSTIDGQSSWQMIVNSDGNSGSAAQVDRSAPDAQQPPAKEILVMALPSAETADIHSNKAGQKDTAKSQLFQRPDTEPR